MKFYIQQHLLSLRHYTFSNSYKKVVVKQQYMVYHFEGLINISYLFLFQITTELETFSPPPTCQVGND